MRIEVFRRFFEAIIDQCQQAGLVWGKELYADATKVQGNAALSSMKPCFAARAHLAALFPQEVQEKAQEESLQQGKGLDQEVADERMDPPSACVACIPPEDDDELLELSSPRQPPTAMDEALQEELTQGNR